MKFSKIILALSMILIFSAQSFAAAVSPTEIINNFAFNAAKLIASEDANFFFSPYSIMTAFSMAYAGAKNETSREIEDVLGFNYKIHSEFGNLIKDLDAEEALSTANRVWLREGLKLKKAYTKILKSNYGSSVKELNFIGENEFSREIINNWVSQKTNEKIKNLLDTLEPDTQMILTNAIYFNAQWDKKFNKRRTSEEKFYVNPEVVKDVQMMKMRDDFSFAEVDGYKILKLPYENRRFSMIAILPVARYQNNFDKIDYETLKKWLGSLEKYEVDLWLPKFKTEIRYELKDLFEALGVKSAFSNFADFTGIAKDEKLKIDRIIHKTFIEVDEEKTEAAAATAVTMVRATAVPPMRDKKKAEFHADHPFMFMILDNKTETILFVGRQNF